MSTPQPTGLSAAAALPRMGEIRSRTGPKRFWTGREEKIIREHYPKGGYPACAPHLPGRSDRSIYAYANKLGLKTPAGEFARESWSSSEQIDAFITRTYQAPPRKNAVADCARIVGRPAWWVAKRAATLGLVAPRFKEDRWTEDEEEIAAQLAHKKLSTIKKALRRAGYARTETSIAVKLKRLGQSRVDPERYSSRGLAQLMGVDSKIITRLIDKGLLRAERKGTARTEAQGGDEWSIHTKDIRKFIVGNAAHVDLRKVDKFWFIELLARPQP